MQPTLFFAAAGVFYAGLAWFFIRIRKENRVLSIKAAFRKMNHISDYDDVPGNPQWVIPTRKVAR